MDLLGELGALVYTSSFLLSSPLGRVEALAVALSMLLDVLVLGHLCLVRGPRALSAVPLQQAALTETHGERWLLLPLMHAYAIAVVTSYVRCMCMRPRVGREQLQKVHVARTPG